MSNKILFFGNERLATGLGTTAPTLRALIDAGYEVTGLIVAQHDIGPSRTDRTPEIVQVATEHHIPVLSPASLNDAHDEIVALGAEIGVLVAYGKLVPASIIELFARGIVNIHPSLLPRHRGPTPIESVILGGESETGVSLMRLAPAMDAGPIYTQQSMALTGNETKLELSERLHQTGTELLVQHLPSILGGSLKPIPQDETQATHDNLIEKSDGQLDFTKPAVRLEREIRAYAVWPRSRASIGDTPVIITEAHVGEAKGEAGKVSVQGKQLVIYTSDGSLIIDNLIPAGKPEMPAEAFLAGYKIN